MKHKQHIKDNFQVLWCFLLQLPILIVNSAETQPALGAPGGATSETGRWALTPNLPTRLSLLRFVDWQFPGNSLWT